MRIDADKRMRKRKEDDKGRGKGRVGEGTLETLSLDSRVVQLGVGVANLTPSNE